MDEANALLPAILLLFVGIVSIVTMRRLGLSPIVGYMIGGLLIGEHAFGLVHESKTTHLLAELGVVFLLFDIGLHFSLRTIWEARRDIFGLGPIQCALCMIAFTGIAMALGISFEISLIVGGALALSSTAVVNPTLRERNQTNCPVGRTATAVLIMQDVLAVFLLILAASIGNETADAESSGLLMTISLAALKGVAAFGVSVLLSRIVIAPLFNAISKTKNEEIFTAIALLIVLSMSAASGWSGLSLTLGAFLGGMMLAETPFRHLIQTEAKPFRDLLLAFFFITIGMTLDWHVLLDSWWQILLFVVSIIVVKTVAISFSARMVGWSVPGSIQLGSLLAQGSEFVFVILSVPALRASLGEQSVGIVFIGVAISLAFTPSIAELGSRIAGKLRKRAPDSVPESESTPIETMAPVVIYGMGDIGRRVADALEAHQIKYEAIDRDFDRFTSAIVDGYPIAFGDLSDLRLAHTMSMDKRAAIVLADVRLDRVRSLMPVVRERFPDLTSFISIRDEELLDEFQKLGLTPVVDDVDIPGLAMAEKVLLSQEVEEQKIAGWIDRLRKTAAVKKEATSI